MQVNMNQSNNIKHGQNEFSEIYKIFEEIYFNAPPVLKDLTDSSVEINYTQSMRDKIDFKKINTKFTNGEYCSITDAIKDIRTVFINCYSFYGIRSDHTKKSLELEALLEEKISRLEKSLRLLADVNLTFNLLNMDGKPSSKLRYPKDYYDSILLRNVAHCRPERLTQYHRSLSTTLPTDEDNANIFKKILIWENGAYFNYIFNRYISSMWELPEIGHFVAIVFKKLGLDVIRQCEIERMFLSPEESTTMGIIMNTLFKPYKTSKFVGQVMTYKVWSEKLSSIVSEWCNVYHANNKNKVMVMNSLGIHPDFWAIVNEKNPLIEKDYCELSYFVKVWLVKGLCDYVTIKFKTINDIVKNCNERQCTIWKNDLGTEEYFFFESMQDVRVYYYNIPYDQPSLEFLESVKPDKEVEGRISAKHNEKQFKLIADSVEGLRSFVNELDIEGSSVPEDLINALEKLITYLEPTEYYYIVLDNVSKVKLFKDWISYSERIEKDTDNIQFLTSKYRKSSLVHYKERIITNRCRKSTGIQYFENNKYKGKKLQTPPKRSQQRKRLLDKEKIPNHDTIMNAKRAKYVNTTNKLVNGQNNTSICLTNKENISPLEEKDLKEIAQAENKEFILKKTSRELVLNHDFENEKFYDTDKYRTENCNNYETDFIDSEGVWSDLPNDNSIYSVQLENTENDVKSSNNTCTLVIGLNQTSICLANSDDIPFLEEKDSIEAQGTIIFSRTEDKTIIESHISIEDVIVIHDEEDDDMSQLAAMFSKNLHLKTNENKSYNSVSTYRQTAHTKHQTISTITSRLSQNISGIPRLSQENSAKKRLTKNFSINPLNVLVSKDLPVSDPSVSVECKIIPKKHQTNGEVEFFIRLPFGRERPISNEVINQYLKQHSNELPEYWLVPLEEVVE